MMKFLSIFPELTRLISNWNPRFCLDDYYVALPENWFLNKFLCVLRWTTLIFIRAKDLSLRSRAKVVSTRPKETFCITNRLKNLSPMLSIRHCQNPIVSWWNFLKIRSMLSNSPSCIKPLKWVFECLLRFIETFDSWPCEWPFNWFWISKNRFFSVNSRRQMFS